MAGFSSEAEVSVSGFRHAAGSFCWPSELDFVGVVMPLVSDSFLDLLRVSRDFFLGGSSAADISSGTSMPILAGNFYTSSNADLTGGQFMVTAGACLASREI